MRYVRDLKFHHNLVDNCNDDGLEFGARKRNHLIYVYQNLISRCLLTLTLHEMEKMVKARRTAPAAASTSAATSLIFAVARTAALPQRTRPDWSVPNGQTMLAGDHGGPTWPNYFFYHNTVLRSDSSWRGYYGFGIGGRATRGTQRRIFNNIFAQIEGLPDLNFTSADDDQIADGNLHWGFKAGPQFPADKNFFDVQGRGFAFRKAPRPAHWLQHDQFANPRFVRFSTEQNSAIDVRPGHNSPTINAGVSLPDDWFDPLRTSDSAGPDVGAFPIDSLVLRVGVRGRVAVGAD